MDQRFDTDKYESGYIPFYVEWVRPPRRILEVGVRKGGSLLLWCALWPSVESVVGIDIDELPVLPDPRITMFRADQGDTLALHRIATETGPFDLIIDDASHIGELSWHTFEALWPHVASGGVYVVEDWGTGYRADWPDGASYSPQPPPGHTAGMAAMIKRLVDEVEDGNVDRLDIIRGMAFVHKSA
jgi:spermidine synthase